MQLLKHFLYSRTIIGFKPVIFLFVLGSSIFLILTKTIRIFTIDNKLIRFFYCIFFGTFLTTIILSTNYFFSENNTFSKTYNIDETSNISNPFIINNQNLRIVYIEIDPRNYKNFIFKVDKNIEILDKTKSLQLKLCKGLFGFNIVKDYTFIL